MAAALAEPVVPPADASPSELPPPGEAADARSEALVATAEEAGLRYVNDDEPGIRRRKAGGGFTYVGPDGRRISDRAELARIRSLAVPPAYRDVWICPDPDGHIQATGRDDKGRKQYRYHPRFREARESNKYAHMLEFADALPGIRAAIDRDMGRRGLPREKVLATIVHLLENTMIRVGNDDYAKQNKSFGLTTLRDRHVAIAGGKLRFAFKGKSGKSWQLELHDRRVAKIVKASQDLPGQRLFQYLDENGERREVTSSDVNAYLREISGRDITAKDFRTWTGTVLAALMLAETEAAESETAAKRNIKAAIEKVSAVLGNTPTICRKCYVHPEVFDMYLDRSLALRIEEGAEALSQEARLRPEEQAVLTLLRDRLQKKARA